MNKWLLGVAMLLSSLFSYAQSPQAMNFQAVARNAGGNPISDKEVGIKIEIVQGSASGTTVYGETHHTTTAKNGGVNLQIGNGTAINGIFTEIDWSQSPYYLRISMDTDGGGNYKEMSTSQMLSVPYALYAERAGTVGSETEKKHDFWVLPNDNNSAMILTGKASLSSTLYNPTSSNFFVKYLDDTDQEVTMEILGLPSDISFNNDCGLKSGPFGRLLTLSILPPKQYTPEAHYSCTIVFKNKYNETKSYPFIYEVRETGVYPESHWKTDDDILASIATIIDPNSDSPWDDYNLLNTEIDIDFMNKRSPDITTPFNEFENKTYTPNSGGMLTSLWQIPYETINRCNNLLEGLAQNTSSDITENVKTNAIKQAKAIRAYAHLMLTSWFGRVPLVLKTLSFSESANVTQSDRSDVLDAIITDFTEAQGVSSLSKEGELTAKDIQILLYEAQLLKGNWQAASAIQAKSGILAFIKKIADWKLNPTAQITEASLMEEYMNNYHSTYKRGNLYLNILNYSAKYFNMDAYKALLPIPQEEMDRNPNLTQNGGY